MSVSTGPAIRTVRWPQYRLRTLLLFVTGCCIAFDLMREIGALGSVVLGFGLLLILCHVVGNALGTRLCDDSTRESAAERESAPPAAAPVRLVMTPSRLREHSPLGRMVVVLTMVGAALGGSLGGLAYAYWGQATAAGTVVGSISAAILGGFLGFMASSFFKTIIRAWRQAMSDVPQRPA